MGNCKDCKHWEARTDGRNKRWNTCGACDWADYDESIGDNDFAIYAYATDDSGLESGFKTGPMFGCIKFQETSTPVSDRECDEDNNEKDLLVIRELYEILKSADNATMERLTSTHPYSSFEGLTLALISAAVWDKPRGWLAQETGISPEAEFIISARIVVAAVYPDFAADQDDEECDEDK